MANRAMSISVAVLAVSLVGLVAAEKKIQRKDLPAAVQKAVQAEEAKGAKVVGLATEVEGGKTLYEVETTVNGRARDLLFDSAGAPVETEETVGIETVPGPVRAAFEARGKVLTVERVTKGGLVTYEAQVDRNGKKSEIAVHADGTPVKP